MFVALFSPTARHNSTFETHSKITENRRDFVAEGLTGGEEGRGGGGGEDDIVEVLSCGFNDRTSCCSRETREERGRRHLFPRCERTGRMVAFIHTIRHASAYSTGLYSGMSDIHMYVRASAYKRSIRCSSLLANRPRDRRVSSKQFMLPGAHRVRRALSGRARSALIRRRMVSHRMAREYKEGGRDVSACRSASLSCRRQTRPL